MCTAHQELEKKIAIFTSNRRTKLWEMDIRWHCSIIGTCLTPLELKKLAQKCGVLMNDETADYQIHTYMVGMARHAKSAGRVVHKYLDRKYARQIKNFATAKNSDAIEALWCAAKDHNEIPGAYWALLSHPLSSSDLVSRVYGEVHMLSHLEGASNRADHKKIADLQGTVEILQDELAGVRNGHRKAIDKRDALIGELKAQLKKLEIKAQRVDEVEARLLAEQDGESLNRMQQRLDCLTARVLQESDRADLAEARLHSLTKEHKEIKNEFRAQERRLLEMEDEITLLEQRAAQSDNLTACMKGQGCPGGEDLCGRCIAYVGGQNKQAAFFRSLVEQRNGQFLHHDGGLHDGQEKLLSILSQADAVMFPVTCISHEASREIKRICQQQAKPFIPLRSQGLGSFSRGLEDLGSDTFNMAAE